MLSDFFCGRDDVIRNVMRCIKEKRPLCWLWGPPGCGTTTVGKAVLHELKDKEGLLSAAVAQCNELSSLRDVEKLIRSHFKQTFKHDHCTFLLDGWDKRLDAGISEEDSGESKFFAAIEALVQELGKEFTVLVTSHRKPSCFTGELDTEPIKVSWLDKEEAAKLLLWHYTGDNKKTLSDFPSIQLKKLQRLALRFDGIPFALKAVGTRGRSDLSELESMPSSIRTSIKHLRPDHLLFKRFCSRFDRGGRLRSCFKRCYDSLPQDLKVPLQCLAIIPGSFTDKFGNKILGHERWERDEIITRLKDRGLIMTFRQRDRGPVNFIPRYFRQYLLAQTFEPQSDIKDARARFFEDVSRCVRKRKVAESRSRILGFLQMPADISDSKVFDVTLAICASPDAKEALLEYVSVDTLRQFCKTSLTRIDKPDCQNQNRLRACVSLFLHRLY